MSLTEKHSYFHYHKVDFLITKSMAQGVSSVSFYTMIVSDFFH